MRKRKLIIDTDCGSDDAVAIAMALRDPAYEVCMISTVAGNVSMEQATRNALTTIEYAGTYEPPVYCGAAHMLLRELAFAYETHGGDGLGDRGFAPERLSEEKENGIFRMLDILRENVAGTIDLIALGPLTNLALAIRLDAEAMRRVRRVVAMGTGGLGRGNVTPVAEFNIWQDAEAAKIVVEFGFEELLFVGWDACLGESMLTAADIENIRSSGRLGRFAMDCNAQLLALNRERFGENCLDMADPAAVAAALCPECIGSCGKYFCEVDTLPGPGYGGFYVDVDGCLGRQPNAFVCSSLKSDVYKEYVFRRLSESGAEETSRRLFSAGERAGS